MRIIKLLAIMMLAVVFGLVACSLEKDKVQDQTKDPSISEDKKSDEKPVVTEEEEPTVDKDENPVVNDGKVPTDDNTPNGTVDDNKEPTNSGEERQYQNNAFMEVTITETDKVVIKGKARVFEGSFQYAVVSGGEVLKGGTYQTDGAPAWGSFEIIVEKEYGAKPGAMFELFVYSAKDGSKIDVLSIPLNKTERLNTN